MISVYLLLDRYKILHDLKAFALSGRQACIHSNPGRCPGLGDSALSGRAGSGVLGRKSNMDCKNDNDRK